MIEIALSVVLLSIVLLSTAGGLFVMLMVTRGTQGVADVSAERAVVRPYLVRDFQALAPDTNGNWGTTSTVWVNSNPKADPPASSWYPSSLPADLVALKSSLQTPLGPFTADWTPGLLVPGCDPVQPEKCRYFSDNPLQANDVRQSFRFRCDPDLSTPGGVEPVVPLLMIWSETWFGNVTDLSASTHAFNRPVSTQIVYRLVRTPKQGPTAPYRCDLVREVHYFPTPEDRAHLISLGAPDDDSNLAAMFPTDSSVISRYIASVDNTQSGSPASWSEIKEVRCDSFDPDGPGGPLPLQTPSDDCRWRYEITLQLQPDVGIGPRPIHIVVSQRARTDAT